MIEVGERVDQDIHRIDSEEFIYICRNGNPCFFTRNRKMPIIDLIFSMINRKGLTLHLELRNYMKIAHPGTEISKPGYLKQRLKLNPAALEDLYQFHNKNFYSDPEAELYTCNGFLVLAADGSDINIPTTSETLEIYGTSSRPNTKPCAQLGCGTIGCI